ncbi:1-acyl-sn-glycerol-3-phosphate acyltransferase [Desulfobacter curvatus]|uniref:1-acyl-sn-glycerol-3-phosphate acyltransferase n=1 Tax=Desulfobacter curvatus TaxID=2290 RepID=UPI00037823D3|nr:alpha/beta hydrolase [Desulfobacter curvatus]
MNKFAYFMSGYALKALSGLSKARITIHNQERIPDGSVIFIANHFTRIETIFLPYHLHGITKKRIWSLAHASLFAGGLRSILDVMGAISTKDPNRDYLITKTLLDGESSWIIFPEGRMVKNKKLVNNGRFEFPVDKLVHRPRSGAAVIALQSEFYRKRLRRMKTINPKEFERLIDWFQIKDPEKVLSQTTYMVPTNITYYPMRAKENLLSSLAQKLMENPSQQLMDELMTEGSMILSGVQVDIRFANPIKIADYFNNSFIESDLTSRRKIVFSRRICSAPVIKAASQDILHRFMADVYGMTTLNYDHIFTCLVKYMPPSPQGIDSYDLRCRAYLAITGKVIDSGRCVHNSFYDNQIHLLTDDRDKRFAAFLDTALETGVLYEKNGKFFKRQEKFAADTGFQGVRMENPLYVVANEVEPLQDIVLSIKDIAGKSDVEIDRQIRHGLMDKVLKDYDLDYEKFDPPKEPFEKEAGKPLIFDPGKGRPGILLIHNYLACPREMKPLADFFSTLGYTVLVPRLKGHGTTPENLSRTSYEDWINSVEEGYVILKHRTSSIFVGGFFTGAGLALELASRIPEIAGVFAVAPPLNVKDVGYRSFTAGEFWHRMLQKARFIDGNLDYRDKGMEDTCSICYHQNPSKGMKALEKLIKHLEERLPFVTAPLLFLQSGKQFHSNTANAEKLFKLVRSIRKDFFFFNTDCHNILSGSESTRVYRSIADFLALVEQDAYQSMGK